MKRLLLLAVILLVIIWHFARSSNAAPVTFDTGQVSCAGSATALVSASAQRTGLLLTNPGTVAVYIGNASVATNTGAYLPGGGSVSIPTKDAVSCISSGASQTVTYLETFNTF